MKPLKVMHIVATDKLSGAEKVVLDICTNLNREKYVPIGICAGEELKKLYESRGIKTYIANVSRLNPSDIKEIKRIVKEENVDLIHAHDVKASIAAHMSGEKMNIPVISHMHSSYPWLERKGALKYIDRYFRKKYALSIACSSMVKEYYLKYNHHIDEKSIVVMNNAFNFNEFFKTPIKDKEEFKKVLNIDGKFVYGFLGRLLETKGADLMIDSFYEVQRINPEAVLIIVGDGPEREKLQNKVKKYAIEEKVIFTGYRSNVYDYINTYDCFILPSVLEGLPIAVLEAMAMKKPVISTPVAGVKNLITNGFNGIFLNDRTREALIKAMIDIYENAEKRTTLGQNAYDYIYENYNINSYIEELEEVYGEIRSY